MPHHCLPDASILDSNPKFWSKFWEELMRLCGAKLRMVLARHLNRDWTSEDMNRVAGNYTPSWCAYKQAYWDMSVPAAAFAYSSAVTEDLGVSPFAVDLRWRLRDIVEVLAGWMSLVQAVHDFQIQLTSAVTAHQEKVTTYPEERKLRVRNKLWRAAYIRPQSSEKLGEEWSGSFTVVQLIEGSEWMIDLAR